MLLSGNEHCLSFFRLVKPRNAYQDSESSSAYHESQLKIHAVAKMTSGIILENHCIVYRAKWYGFIHKGQQNEIGSYVAVLFFVTIYQLVRVYGTPTYFY